MLLIPDAAEPASGRGKLAENVMHFARLLRGAGLRVGPNRVIDCMKAIELAGTGRRDDFYWTMSAVFLSREEQRPIFDQAFRIFWRDPKLIEKMMQALLPKTYGKTGKEEQEQSQRLTDALFNEPKRDPSPAPRARWNRACSPNSSAAPHCRGGARASRTGRSPPAAPSSSRPSASPRSRSWPSCG